MATEEEVPMEVSEPSTSSRPAPAAAVVRTSIPRPSKFTGRGDVALWFKRFKLYAKRARIPSEEWAEELLLLLEDEPFRLVSLSDSEDYESVKERLRERFAPDGNEIEWQQRLQSRSQERGEALEDFAGDLQRLAEKAYPDLDGGQRERFVRNQFVQGLLSSTAQLLLLKEMPQSIDDALRLAKKQHTVEEAQRRLRQRKHGGDVEAVIAVDSEETGNITVTKKQGVEQGTLFQQVRHLEEAVAQLQVQTGSRGTQKRKVVCWQCGGEGHIKRDCTKRKPAWRGPQNKLATTSVPESTKDVQKPSVVVQGRVDGVSTKMLVDTGSMVTLVRKDLWEEASGESRSLRPPSRSIVTANGKALEIMGQVDICLSIGDFSCVFLVLVSEKLTQQCVLGADFLIKTGCMVDLQRGHLVIGKEIIPLQSHCQGTRGIGEVASYCVAVLEDGIVPPLHQVQLPVQLQTKNAVEYDGVLEPSKKFTERHQLLLAHSVVHCSGNNTVVQILNPTLQPIVLHVHEVVGHFYPLSKEDQVCTLGDCAKVPEGRREWKLAKRQRSSMIQRLMADIEGLSPEQTSKLHEMLRGYADVISQNDGDLGKTNLVKHRIDTQGANPIRQPVRRLPIQQRKEVQGMLHDMLKKGVIEHSHSPWASPIVLVKKRDGSHRFCIDFRRVNAVTKKDAQPLPRIDDTLDVLAGSSWFSTLDLASGYWQVGMEECDREKTAFATPFGLFQFKVMPFGLCNAPATLQRLMELVLSGVHWSVCLVYLDDIIIFSKSVDEHLKQLQQVFQCLRAANLKIKPSKCQLFRKSVRYLGHIVSAKGIEADPGKVAAVMQWPVPKGQKDLKQFLGFMSYYRRFVPNFSSIAAPLNKLTEKNVAWVWGPHCEQAFKQLKQALTHPPILIFPRSDCTFLLDVDACATGVGAVLSQYVDGKEHVVAYASRALSKVERRYCVTRQEMLALVWAVKHFRAYLYGRPFSQDGSPVIEMAAKL